MQIETRILRVIRDLEIVDLKSVEFKADLRRDLRIDSLNVVALLTSIEHEFTTVFEDSVFEGVKTLDEVVTVLMRDPKII
jgi:NADH dehydrogenase (ubiquinone) 1 alpha/beta subcomplex 1, acyl-carrier protein